MKEDVLIDLSNIEVTFFGSGGRKLTVFKDLNLTFPVQKCIVIMGPNGVGKSTLLNLLAGIVTPNEGCVYYRSGELNKKSIVFQRYEESLFEWFTVAENIAYPLRLRNIAPKERYRKAEEINERLKLELPLEKFPYQLSGGQKQRVALARALITSPEVLFLDEPFASLDLDSKRVVQQSLNDIIISKDLTIIVATHEIRDALTIADEVWFLSGQPSRVVETVIIDLPRPRLLFDLDDIKIGGLLKSLEKGLEYSFSINNKS